jgi:hypothetical protein
MDKYLLFNCDDKDQNQNMVLNVVKYDKKMIPIFITLSVDSRMDIWYHVIRLIHVNTIL